MIAVVTGASSGIGREFVKQIDSKGYDEIWIIARRRDRLKNLSENLNTKSKIINIDLLDDKSFEILEDLLEKEIPNIGLLINAAGFGISDNFENLGLTTNSEIVRLNDEALTKMISLCLPFMMSKGLIINIASVAAFLPQANFATYAASKSYVLSLSRALNIELKDRQIKVSCLCPNPVDTEFFDKTPTKRSNNIKKIGKENLEKMVEKTLKHASKKDLITTHPVSKLILIISKILPHNLIMKFEKILGLY